MYKKNTKILTKIHVDKNFKMQALKQNVSNTNPTKMLKTQNNISNC